MIQGMVPSPPRHSVALGLSAAGAEFSEIKIIDLGITPREFPMASIDESYPKVYAVTHAGAPKSECRPELAPGRVVR